MRHKIQSECGMHAMWHKTGNTLSVMVNGRETSSKKGSGAAHQQELDDAPVPPRGPGAREGAGAGPLQDFLPDEH